MGEGAAGTTKNLGRGSLGDAEIQDSWAARSGYWLAESSRVKSRKRRDREKHPLYLTGQGMSIRVDKGCLLIKDGNTHYPSDRREWRFFKGGLEIPPVIVAVDGSGEITMDALDWLATQAVPLIRLRWDGQFASVVTTSGQAASTEKVRRQEKTRLNPAKRLEFALDLIRGKAHFTVTTMKDHVPRSKVWGRAYDDIVTRARRLEQRPPRSLEELLGIEGAIAQEYFRAWSAIPLKWKATKQKPIPDDWREYRSRSALRGGSVRNYRATHPVNAMLNYAYGVLTARTQVRLIAEGYDPTIGIMHDRVQDRGNYRALALDHMEPMRPVVDRSVLQFVSEETLSGTDFMIQDDGCCRLNPELVRRVAQLAVEHYSAVGDTAWNPLGG